MKKLYFVVLFLTLLIACKKTEFSPEGPTDVRVRNMSGYDFIEVKVGIKEEEISFGTIEQNSTSEYHRFKTAFPKAFISADIDENTLTTGQVDYTYMNYFGLVKLTYDVIVENQQLKIINVTLDSELEIK